MQLRIVAAALALAACTPAPRKGPARALQIVHNQNNRERARRIALDDRYVYMLDGTTESFGIRRIPRGGGTTETVTAAIESGSSPTAIALDGTHLYFMVLVGEDSITDRKEPRTRVFRAAKTLEPRLEELATVDGEPGDLLLLGDDVVFSTIEQAPALHRIGKSGSSETVVLELPAKSRPIDLFAHGGKLLVADSQRGAVFEVSLAGEAREVMKVDQPLELAAFGDKVAVVAWKGVFALPSGTQLARGSREATFDALAAAPEGLYYKHHYQLRFLPWGGDKAQILQKVHFDFEDVVIADEGIYYVDSDELWFRARAGS